MGTTDEKTRKSRYRADEVPREQPRDVLYVAGPRRVYLPGSEDFLAVRYADIERVDRLCTQLCVSQPGLARWYSLLFGFAGGCAPTLVTYACSSAAVPLIVRGLTLALALSLSIGMVLVYADRVIRRYRMNLGGEVRRELGAVLAQFRDHPGWQAPVTPPQGSEMRQPSVDNG